MQSQEDKVILEWLCHTQSHIITAVDHVTHICKGDAAARRAIRQSMMDLTAKACLRARETALPAKPGEDPICDGGETVWPRMFMGTEKHTFICHRSNALGLA